MGSGCVGGPWEAPESGRHPRLRERLESEGRGSRGRPGGRDGKPGWLRASARLSRPGGSRAKELRGTSEIHHEVPSTLFKGPCFFFLKGTF